MPLLQVLHNLTMICQRWLIATFLCCTLGLGTAVAAPSLGDGFDAYNRGDHARAIKIWKSLAAQGNGGAQTFLGAMYRGGEGVTQNYQEALKWYRLAAAQGFANAQTGLGAMYHSGEGVTQDYREALKWYRLAAAQGEATAQNDIGVMYQKGQGVAQNYPEAMKWYRLSAAQGNATAQLNVGIMYGKGQGVTQNFPEALKWLRLAAAQGDATAIEMVAAAQDSTVEQPQRATNRSQTNESVDPSYLGTLSVTYQPIYTAGELEGCSLVYTAAQSDYVYHKGETIFINGSITVGGIYGLTLKIGVKELVGGAPNGFSKFCISTDQISFNCKDQVGNS